MGNTLSVKELKLIDAYWRAANYLSRTSKCGDLFGGGTRIRLIEAFQSDLADAVKVGVVTPDQLDEDGFLRLEVVVQTAREDACRVGDLLQGATQARRGDDGIRGLQNLGAPRRINGWLVSTGGELRGAPPLLARRPAAGGIPAPGVGIGHR